MHEINTYFICASGTYKKLLLKNPAYGRQRISRPTRIVGPIQFWRGCVVYLKKKQLLKQFSSKIFETIFIQNLWNKFPPKSLKIFSSKNFETNFLQNLWDYFGGVNQWEAGIWSCDLRANERPQKKWEAALLARDLLCSPGTRWRRQTYIYT